MQVPRLVAAQLREAVRPTRWVRRPQAAARRASVLPRLWRAGSTTAPKEPPAALDLRVLPTPVRVQLACLQIDSAVLNVQQQRVGVE